MQVLTSVLSYYTRGKPPLTFSCPGKTPADYWGKSSGETELMFFKGELLHGCMDKAQYGKFGLVHAVQVTCSHFATLPYNCDVHTMNCEEVIVLIHVSHEFASWLIHNREFQDHVYTTYCIQLFCLVVNNYLWCWCSQAAMQKL